MKLIRRKRKPTPAQKALDILRTVLRGLAAVRVARSAYGTYKFARRLPLLLALAVAAAGAAVAARKLRGGGDGPEVETWSPPPASTAATNGGSATTPPAPSAAATAPAAPEPDRSPEPELHANPAETAATGTPPVELAEADAPITAVEPADDLPAAGTADEPAGDAETLIGDDLSAAAESAGPPADAPELDTEVASDAVPAPNAEPGPGDDRA